MSYNNYSLFFEIKCISGYISVLYCFMLLNYSNRGAPGSRSDKLITGEYASLGERFYYRTHFTIKRLQAIMQPATIQIIHNLLDIYII